MDALRADRFPVKEQFRKFVEANTQQRVDMAAYFFQFSKCFSIFICAGQTLQQRDGIPR